MRAELCNSFYCSNIQKEGVLGVGIVTEKALIIILILTLLRTKVIMNTTLSELDRFPYKNK